MAVYVSNPFLETYNFEGEMIFKVKPTKYGTVTFILMLLIFVASCDNSQNNDNSDTLLYPNHWEVISRNVVIGVHRGLLGYPENSYEAIKAAIDAGHTVIEIDLAVTKDGVFVVHHDATIDRCSNGSGYLKDYTLDELRHYNFGAYLGIPDIKIPTLEDVLRLCKEKNALLELDLSNGEVILNEHIEQIYNIVKKHRMLQNVLFCSNKNKLSLLTSNHMDVNISCAIWVVSEFSDIINLKSKCKLLYISIPHNQISSSFCELVHSEGLLIEGWTCVTESDISNALNKGVDYVLIDTNI